MLKLAKIENADEIEKFVKEHCKKDDYTPTKTWKIKVTKKV